MMTITETDLKFMTTPRQLTKIAISAINGSPAPVSKARQVSLTELGQIDPIRVRQLPNSRYEIINGRRRVANLAAAGVTEVEAIIEDADQEAAAWSALALNMSGSPSPMVEARLISDLIALGYTQKVIARRLGITQGNVSQRVGLMALIPPLQDALESGEMVLTAARMVVKLPENEQAAFYAAGDLTTEAAKEALRNWQAGEVELSGIDIPDLSEPESGRPVSLSLTAEQWSALTEGGEVIIEAAGLRLNISTERR